MLIPVPITDEQAKLGQEAAKTTRDLITLVGDAGRSLGKSQLATIASDVVGHWLGADKLHDRRLLQLGMLKARRDALLENIDPVRIGEPSPSVVLPLLEAAMDESREQLQDLWARMLANAMIDGGSRVRDNFFSTLKGLEPLDVAVLDLFGVRDVSAEANSQAQISAMERILRERRVEGFIDDALAVSLEALQTSRCIHTDTISVWRMTAYGRQFVTACRVE